jgi:hypothetical protein
MTVEGTAPFVPQLTRAVQALMKTLRTNALSNSGDVVVNYFAADSRDRIEDSRESFKHHALMSCINAATSIGVATGADATHTPPKYLF